nr:zf-HC2 domain-containing protein [Oscillospiraceae bacterium]
MKLPCEMILDLLPLYHDGVCSPVSKTLVAEHLKDCPDCAGAMEVLKSDLQMPKLESDEAKPLKSIKRRWTKKAWITGLLIGVLLFFGWVELTQHRSVKIAPEDYEVTKVIQFSNGMYYLEYRIPYDYNGIGADLRRTEDGAVYFQEYRPILARRDTEKGIIRDNIIDPENHRTDMGTEMPMTAFYLGSPGSEDAVLLWSAEEDYPMATPEEEQEYLYQHIFR